jgi:hypothetical protein
MIFIMQACSSDCHYIVFLPVPITLDGRIYAGSNGWQYYMLVRNMEGQNIRAMESYRLCMLNNCLIDISDLLGHGTVSLGLVLSISGQLCLKT